MTPDTLVPFAIASALILAAPGPVVLYAVHSTLGHGRAVAWMLLPGVIAGDAAAMTLSLLGVGAALAASEGLYTVLRLAGAAYLIWLGGRSLLSRDKAGDPARGAATSRFRVFSTAFTLAFLHPGGFVFYVAFVPQFVDHTAPLVPQLVILTGTFLAITAATLLAWIGFADGLQRRLDTSPAVVPLRRIAGLVMVGVGVAGVLSV